MNSMELTTFRKDTLFFVVGAQAGVWGVGKHGLSGCKKTNNWDRRNFYCDVDSPHTPICFFLNNNY